jgi:LPXTG-motif cell wall-anchored protein
VKIPTCYYQVDLVVGDVIAHLDDGHLYGDRKLDADHGGDHSCTAQCQDTTTLAAVASHTAVSWDAASGTYSAAVTIQEGCDNVTISLVSYKMPVPVWGMPQQLYAADTKVLNGGQSASFTVKAPDCWHQVDLIVGSPKETLTETDDYRYDVDLIDAAHGGDHSCTAQCPSGPAAVSEHHLSDNGDGTYTGTFSVAEGCSGIKVSLASYKAPGPGTLPQELFDSQTGSFDAGGPYSFTVKVPSCYHQVYLVMGDVITSLDEEHLYGDRELDTGQGGDHSCDQQCASPGPGDVQNARLSVSGGTAHAQFDIAGDCTQVPVSLITYRATSAGGGTPQTLFAWRTGTFDHGAGRTLSAPVPACYYAVYLVFGTNVLPVVDERSGYGDKMLLSAQGGSGSCGSTSGGDSGDADTTTTTTVTSTTVVQVPTELYSGAQATLSSYDWLANTGSTIWTGLLGLILMVTGGLVIVRSRRRSAREGSPGRRRR